MITRYPPRNAIQAIVAIAMVGYALYKAPALVALVVGMTLLVALFVWSADHYNEWEQSRKNRSQTHDR